MANLQIEKTSAVDIQGRVSNPFGVSPAKLMENYQAQANYEGQNIEEVHYKNLQKAEANYFLAAAGLGKSNTIQQYNAIARMQGYGAVNIMHRHDVE